MLIYKCRGVVSRFAHRIERREAPSHSPVHVPAGSSKALPNIALIKKREYGSRDFSKISKRPLKSGTSGARKER